MCAHKSSVCCMFMCTYTHTHTHTLLHSPPLPPYTHTHTHTHTHTQKAVILLTYRWYAYKKIGSHYFLFDFCYFTNFLLLNYLWLPENILGPTLRGALYSACFSFSMGPLLSAIILWRNSLVPHSNDKMTSLFIHVSPPLAVWGIRW